MSTLSRARVCGLMTFVVILTVAALAAPSEACQSTRGQVPAGTCARTAVMAQAVTGPVVPGDTCHVQVDLFVLCDPNGGGGCATLTGASATVALVGPSPGSGVLASATVNPTLACDAGGVWNRFDVAVPVPGGATPGVYTVQGSTVLQFSDATELTATGDAVACVVGSVQVEIQALDPFVRDAAGNVSRVRFRFTNHTMSHVCVSAQVVSTQLARRPTGGTEVDGVYAISETGDDFPVSFNARQCDLNPPPDAFLGDHPTASDLVDVDAGQSLVVEVGVQSGLGCLDGACSQLNLTATLGGVPVAAAGAAVFVDSEMPQECPPAVIAELSQDLSHTPPPADYFGGTIWDLADSRWEAIPGGTWTFDSGVGSSFSPVPGLDPGKEPGLHTLMEGWLGVDRSRKSVEEPGPGGDWSDLVSLADLPDPLTPCACALSDTVLAFEENGGHGGYQDNLAVSPWVDLSTETGRPGKVVEFSAYADLPVQDYVCLVVAVQWEDAGGRSGFLDDGYVYYSGTGRRCTTSGEAYRLDVSHLVPPDATAMRVGLGVLNWSRYHADATGLSNVSPYFDNVRVGVYGNAGDPAVITARSVDLPQDAFPANGTLNTNAPCRVDAARVMGATSPEPGTSLGDTLVVRGARGDAEVYVQFRAEPGPGTDPGLFSSFLGRFADLGSGWYSARMDTAEVAGVPVPGLWMTAFHEDDPAFTGTNTDLDPTDVAYLGSPNHLANDMFSDNVLTPGARIDLFYKTRSVGGAVWATFPRGIDPDDPTAAGVPFLEWEGMPSSTDASGNFNCVLYVNHEGRSGSLDGPLTSILGTGSGNFEGTNFDRFDVRAPDSHQTSFGQPLDAAYGATITQVLGYKTLLWETGDLPSFNLTQEDADVLTPWLSLIDWDYNNLYLSGDQIVSGAAREAATEPSALKLVTDLTGVLSTCGTYRDADCPPGKIEDPTACVGLDPASGALVAEAGGFTRSVAEHAQGNGCPEMRSFGVLAPNPSPRFGVGVGDEVYSTDLAPSTEFASVANDAAAAGYLHYRTVVDGVSVADRGDAACQGTTAVEERLTEVMTFLGTATYCLDSPDGIGIPPDPAEPWTPHTAILGVSPNPLRAGTAGVLSFTLATAGRARIEIFDLAGRRVAVPLDGIASRGKHTVTWNGTDETGRRVASGVYFYRLSAAGQEKTARLVVIGG